MSGAAPTPETAGPPAMAERVERVDAAKVEALAHEAADRVRQALDRGDLDRLQNIVEDLHAADAADMLQELTADERKIVVAVCRHVIEPETLNHLEETVREEVIALLGPSELAQAVTELETDDALEIFADLEEDEQRQVLEALPAEERSEIEQGLAYPEDSAGRLMQRELVAAPARWTVGETIDFLRSAADLPEDFYDLFVVDEGGKPVGAVPLSRAMRNARQVKLTDIMDSELILVPVAMDQEKVAHLFRQYALVSAPVVDGDGKLVGVVTVDDVVHVIDEEAEEDLLGIVGVGETDYNAPALETAWRRLRWLIVTLVNSAIAATVILQFQATIEQIVALAVLMPIVAAMGGNAGVQVITVTVRALATRDLSPLGSAKWRLIGKEVAVAAMNAALFASIMGAVAGYWFDSAALGLVLAGAMIFNMIWAGFAGTVIPLTLARLGVDPAIGAGPFLTTTTDVLGFFSFLGLASLFLL